MDLLIQSLSEKRKTADLLIVGCFEKESPARLLQKIDSGFSAAVQAALSRKRFSGKAGQTLSSYSADSKEAAELVLVGLGPKGKLKVPAIRKIAGRILSVAKAAGLGRARFLLDSFSGGEVSAVDAAAQIAETLTLADYRFDKYKAKKKGAPKPKLITAELLCLKKPAASLKERTKIARAIAQGTILARDLINEPANVLIPAKMAEIASQMAEKKKISCKLIKKPELKRLKMGGILAVNQGSVHAPVLIVMEYGRRFKSKGTVCLVGKGVCFDTGGLSIKPSKGMEKMKYDMSGGAAVIGTMSVLSDIGLKKHVIGLVPAVENNVAADPIRPGDIIRMFNGKTVEVLNTDAEGRLILADALAYTEKYKPKALIDAATLTGMCVATFGDQAIGLLGNNQALQDRIKKSGYATGERCWELPMWEEYGQQIRGHHSDLVNIGGPYGGTITAAKFLEQFIPPKTAWAHLDIAGVAWADSPRPDCVKGGTGAGVRLLANVLMGMR